MSSPNNRKRPAPDLANTLQQQLQQQQQQQATLSAQEQQLLSQTQGFSPVGDQIIRWNGENGIIMDPNGNAIYTGLVPNTQGQFISSAVDTTNSTALTRRTPGGRAIMQTGSQWTTAMMPANPHTALTTLPQTAPSSEMLEQNHIQKLEAIAQEAKKEALANKKQIPPFVQKLNSFLDDKTGKYHDLIRWSDKGDSFFVMNEDEFAKKLIPDLFKHNNYASFVRQLNMYGFHKRVGLSDNSMRASERKNKSPSEYYNDYFRRGHPDLLWLITKPKNNKSKNRQQTKTESDGESGDEASHDDKSGVLGQGPKALPTNGSEHLISRKELAKIQEELRKCRENQDIINQNLARYHDETRELFRIHTRHDQHLRAIMGFLAMHFRKSLEGENNSTNFHELLSAYMPNNGMNHQSSMFDVGEYVPNSHQTQSPMGATKRARHLLEAPPTARSPSQLNNFVGQNFHPKPGVVTEIHEHTPDTIHNISGLSQSGEFNGILSNGASNGVFHSLPTTSSVPGSTVPAISASSHRSTVESVKTSPVIPLATPAATITPVPVPGVSTSSTVPAISAPLQVLPPAIPATSGASPTTTLSPILRSIAPPSTFPETSPEEVLRLQRMVQEQDANLQQISNRISPISPGRIHFDLSDPNSLNYFSNDPGGFDINEFLDTSAYGTEEPDFSSAFPSLTTDASESLEISPTTIGASTAAPSIPITAVASTAPALSGLGTMIPNSLSSIGIPPGADLSDLSMNSPVMEPSMPVGSAALGLDDELLSSHLPQPENKRRRVN